MARDALDAGINGDYPYWPRNPDGSWDSRKMPVGLHEQGGVLVDLTPRDGDGAAIVPPGMTLPATCRCASHGGK